MKYKSIKQILKKQIDCKLRTLWQHDTKNNVFIQIYKCYDQSLKIYTPAQLLNKLNDAYTS